MGMCLVNYCLFVKIWIVSRDNLEILVHIIQLWYQYKNILYYKTLVIIKSLNYIICLYSNLYNIM